MLSAIVCLLVISYNQNSAGCKYNVSCPDRDPQCEHSEPFCGVLDMVICGIEHPGCSISYEFLSSNESACIYFCNTSDRKEEKFYAVVKLDTGQDVLPDKIIPIIKPTEVYSIGITNSGKEIGISIILDIKKKDVTQKISVYQKYLEGRWTFLYGKESTDDKEVVFGSETRLRLNDVSLSYRIFKETS